MWDRADLLFHSFVKLQEEKEKLFMESRSALFLTYHMKGAVVRLVILQGFF